MAGSCQDVLESFLHDMEALDQQNAAQQTAVLRLELKKRPLDAAHKTQTITKKKSKTPSWIKTKRELQALRQESQTLQMQLNVLKWQNAIQQADRGKLPEETSKQWKSLVQTEKQLQEAALETNKRIKNSLQYCIWQSERLQSALTATRGQRDAFLKSTDEFGVQFGDANLIRILDKQVDARYQELRPSFNAKMEVLTVPDTDVVEKKYDHVVGKAEFAREQLLPFQERAIYSAVWSIIEGGQFPDGHACDVVRLSEDAYAMTMCTRVRLDDGGATFLNSTAVIKRFKTPNGFVVLTEAKSEYIANLATSGPWSHITRERGCFETRQCPVADGSALCCLSSALDLQPSELSTSSRRYPVASPCTIKSVVIPTFRQLFCSRNQFVENALFDTIRAQN